MASRWWEPPRLYSTRNEAGERKVTWLELFYDLVYVATIIQLGDLLSHDVSPLGFLEFAALFVPIWWSWTGMMFYFNRFIVDDVWHRLMVFAQILAIALLAVSVSTAFEEGATRFALAYFLIRVVLVILYVRAGQAIPEARTLARRFAGGYAMGASIWLLSIFVPSPWRFAIWLLAMGVDLAASLRPATRRLAAVQVPPDVPHMAERYGLFTLIVFGESFLKVTNYASEEPLGVQAAIFGVLGLTIAFSLWWLYFDDVAGAEPVRRPTPTYFWIYTHFPLALGITALAVGITKLVLLEPGAALAVPYRWLLCGSVAITLVAIAILDEVTVRSDELLDNGTRALYRIAAAGIIVLLAAFGGGLPPLVLVGLVALACVAQVVLDFRTAPLPQTREGAIALED